MNQLSHFDENGDAHMVNVGAKPETERVAIARCEVHMLPQTLQLIRDKGHAKGDVLQVARIAGIMGAKKTGELIPLCHPLAIDSVSIDFDIISPGGLQVEAKVSTTGKTGVEMEALSAVTTAALTIYDMCKAVDRAMEIQSVLLVEKSGGKSGHFQHPKLSKNFNQ